MRFTLTASAPQCEYAKPDAATEIHTLTFLANSGQEMVNGYTVDLATLRAPLIDGTSKLVKDLTEADRLTLPLLIDHWDSIDAQAGAVKSLWLTEAGLMAEATVTEATRAGEMVTGLARADALTNSFSITIESDSEPTDDGVIYNAELIEISVVYRGADQRAAFTSFNSRQSEGEGNHEKHNNDKEKEQDTMSVLEKFTKGFALTQDEADELKTIIDGATETAAETINGAIDAKTAASEDEETPTIDEAVPVENTRKAAPAVMVAGRAKVRNAGNWLDSDEAVESFSRILFAQDNRGTGSTRDAWGHELARQSRRHSFGVTFDEGTPALPTPVVGKIYDALNQGNHEIWDSLNHTGFVSLTDFYRANDTTLDATNGANYYPQSQYGQNKTEQENTLTPRTLTPDFIYKFLRVNRGDIENTRRARGGASFLLDYLLEEMVNRTLSQLEFDVIMGNHNNGSRGIFSIYGDAAAANGFATAAPLSEAADAAPVIQQVAEALAGLRGDGERILVTSREFATKLRWGQTSGNMVLGFAGDEGLAGVLGIDRIITPDWFSANNGVSDDVTVAAVAYSADSYRTVGDKGVDLFRNFDLQTNQEQMLAETWTGGGLMVPGAGLALTLS